MPTGKSNENETNIHKKLKGIIETANNINKTRKESSDKDEGSTNEREAYQMKEKGTNRQGEKKYYNYREPTGRVKKNIQLQSK